MIFKKNKGSALILTLVIILFLSILGATSFKVSKSSLSVANNINTSNIKFQAAEKAIQATILKDFNTDEDIAEMVYLSPTEIKRYCMSTDTIKTDDNCDNAYLNNDKTITSQSELTLNKTAECLAYGSSDQKAYCFVITGEGDIPSLNKKPQTNVQEIQVNIINVNNNGVYEL